MALHPLAGTHAPEDALVDVQKLLTAYSTERPDPKEPQQRVAFGTSGHRGSAFRRSFNDAHIAAVAQAVCERRKSQGIDGPLFMGMDTHALSAPAQRTALEVLAANGVSTFYSPDAFTPTPVVSHAILGWNRGRKSGFADGLIITPSHNPPEDGGIKYNPPHGGPADTGDTSAIEARANALLEQGLSGVRRLSQAQARSASTTQVHDFVRAYVDDLENVIDVRAIKAAGLRLGADPMGGANAAYWAPIAERYALDITVVNPTIDPRFAFMPLDHDGKIRMDCSSPYAMANLVAQKDQYDVSFGNDADSDRHGIVTRQGLMSPNRYLAVAIDYLFQHRAWKDEVAVGKTLVSSALIDRVARKLGRRLYEVPVGFKYFVQGLRAGSLGFGGEESAGASFLRFDGSVWTTDKDGILLDLLAAEMMARTGKDPSVHEQKLVGELGAPVYTRIDAPATPAQKAKLKKLQPAQVTATMLAGQPIRAKLVAAPGDHAPIGGLKVVTDDGWFAARPSGTEAIYKIYAESFLGEAHLQLILDEARVLVGSVLAA